MAHIIAFHKLGEVRIEQLRHEINQQTKLLNFEFPQMAIQWHGEYIEIEDIGDFVTNHTAEIGTVVDAQVPTMTYFDSEVDDVTTTTARTGWRDLGDWATWTPDQAQEYVRTQVLNGMDSTEINAWIDANLTGSNVAQLRAQVITALKLLAANIITIRAILGIVVKVILYIRDILIKRL